MMSTRTDRSLIDEAAERVLALINSQPSTPRREEIADAIAAALGLPPAVEPRAEPAHDLGVVAALADHAAFRSLVDRMKDIAKEIVEGGQAAIEEEEARYTRLLEEAEAIALRVWARPAKTWADVCLRAEIALHYENGVMEELDNVDGYADERAFAQLIHAAVTVGRERGDHNWKVSAT